MSWTPCFLNIAKKDTHGQGNDKTIPLIISGRPYTMYSLPPITLTLLLSG